MQGYGARILVADDQLWDLAFQCFGCKGVSLSRSLPTGRATHRLLPTLFLALAGSPLELDRRRRYPSAMKPKDLFALLSLFGTGITIYRLLNPQCPHCDKALAALTIAQSVVCPHCGRSVTRAQALLGRVIWERLFA